MASKYVSVNFNEQKHNVVVGNAAPGGGADVLVTVDLTNATNQMQTLRALDYIRQRIVEMSSWPKV